MIILLRFIVIVVELDRLRAGASRGVDSRLNVLGWYIQEQWLEMGKIPLDLDRLVLHSLLYTSFDVQCLIGPALWMFHAGVLRKRLMLHCLSISTADCSCVWNGRQRGCLFTVCIILCKTCLLNRVSLLVFSCNGTYEEQGSLWNTSMSQADRFQMSVLPLERLPIIRALESFHVFSAFSLILSAMSYQGWESTHW